MKRWLGEGALGKSQPYREHINPMCVEYLSDAMPDWDFVALVYDFMEEVEKPAKRAIAANDNAVWDVRFGEVA